MAVGSSFFKPSGTSAQDAFFGFFSWRLAKRKQKRQLCSLQTKRKVFSSPSSFVWFNLLLRVYFENSRQLIYGDDIQKRKTDNIAQMWKKRNKNTPGDKKEPLVHVLCSPRERERDSFYARSFTTLKLTEGFCCLWKESSRHLSHFKKLSNAKKKWRYWTRYGNGLPNLVKAAR